MDSTVKILKEILKALGSKTSGKKENLLRSIYIILEHIAERHREMALIINEDEILKSVSSVLNKNRSLLENVGRCIWENPELAFKEVFAHGILTETLQKLGFEVKKNFVVSTGFRAEFSSGKGPTVAVICEYDALPGIGHACGHNLIAENGVAAGLAVKHVLENFRIFGKIVIMGTPAEEGGGGKISMLKAGAFDDIDVVVMAHPETINCTSPLILTISRVEVTYIARATYKEASSLDAAVSCYNQMSLLRQRINSKCRIMGIIKNNEVNSLNVPKKTVLHYHLRAPSSSELLSVKKAAEACFISAAHGTGCKVHYKYETGRNYETLVANNILTGIYKEYAEKFGVVFDDDDPSIIPHAVSSDIGNVSHIVPSIHPIFAIGKGYNIHSPNFALLANSPEAQHATLIAAQAMAMTCVRVLSSPSILQDIKEEFKMQLEKDKVGVQI